jgi:hypothetical protein
VDVSTDPPTIARITHNNTAANAVTSTATQKINQTEIINDKYVSYGLKIVCTGLLNSSLCKYDVASKNMVIVLTKKEVHIYMCIYKCVHVYIHIWFYICGHIKFFFMQVVDSIY